MYRIVETGGVIDLVNNIYIPESSPNYLEYLRWRDGWTEELYEMQLQDVEKTIEHPEQLIPGEELPDGSFTDSEIIPAWTETITAQEYVRVVTGTVEHPPHEPEPADPIPVPVIDTISMRQARLQLLSMPFGEGSLLDAVNASVSGLSQAAQVEWEYATEVKKDNILFQQIAVALGFSETDITDFFTTASLL